MSLVSRKYEKGRLVTRFCGVRVWRSADEPALSLQAQLLRRELLTAADVGNMPPARGYARDVQLAGVVLLKEVLRVARENGFHPWTISGSLLGTVRHGGRFVPWDDDVDQGMLRDEYTASARCSTRSAARATTPGGGSRASGTRSRCRTANFRRTSRRP